METDVNRMRTINLASFDEMLRTAEPNELMKVTEVAVQVDLLYRRYTVVEPGPVSPRITDLLVNDHTFIEWSLSEFFKPFAARCEIEAFKRFGKPMPAAGGGGVGGFGGGNGQSALVVKAKGKTVMNKFPKLVAIKKDNSNATEHYSYLFELFVALRANLARPKCASSTSTYRRNIGRRLGCTFPTPAKRAPQQTSQEGMSMWVRLKRSGS